MKPHNNNCDGDHCTSEHGEVRVYPIGSGGNLILCLSCFAHENRFNFTRGAETKHPEWFPQVNWANAKLYPNETQPMKKYKVSVFATKEGAVHMNNAEHRTYVVAADSVEGARMAAIEAAYKEGGLEHINPRTVTALPD